MTSPSSRFTAHLVCEGACNPSLPELKQAVRRDREVFDPPEPVSLGVALALRKLKHTLHYRGHRHDVWVCASCETRRHW